MGFDPVEIGHTVAVGGRDVAGLADLFGDAAQDCQTDHPYPLGRDGIYRQAPQPRSGTIGTTVNVSLQKPFFFCGVEQSVQRGFWQVQLVFQHGGGHRDPRLGNLLQQDQKPQIGRDLVLFVGNSVVRHCHTSYLSGSSINAISGTSATNIHVAIRATRYIVEYLSRRKYGTPVTPEAT